MDTQTSRWHLSASPLIRWGLCSCFHSVLCDSCIADQVWRLMWRTYCRVPEWSMAWPHRWYPSPHWQAWWFIQHDSKATLSLNCVMSPKDTSSCSLKHSMHNLTHLWLFRIVVEAFILEAEHILPGWRCAWHANKVDRMHSWLWVVQQNELQLLAAHKTCQLSFSMPVTSPPHPSWIQHLVSLPSPPSPSITLMHWQSAEGYHERPLNTWF